MGSSKIMSRDFSDRGFKVLAASPVLQKLSAEMREARESKEREKRERLEKIKAAHAQPALDLSVKISPSVRRRMQERD